MEDVVRAEHLCDELGEIFCLTFIKGVDESAALLRMGGYPDTVAMRTGPEMAALAESFDAGLPTMAAALALGPWSVVIEPDGFHGADASLLKAASVGTEAVSVLRHDYASPYFAYAVDGALVVGFDPSDPDELQRSGIDPVGFRT